MANIHEQVERAIVFFDPSDHYPKRCVSCNNPIMKWGWNEIEDYVREGALGGRWKAEGGLLKDHRRPCGMMWDPVSKAHNLSDLVACRRTHTHRM